jgi:type I restriction enzyme S subunit
MSPDALPVTELHAASDTRLPEGWAWASLGEILPLEYGKALPERLRDSTGTVAVYGSSGRVGWHTAAMVTGPTLIVGRKGSAGAVFYCNEDCWPIDTVYFTDPKRVIDLRYGYHFLKWKALGRLDQSTAIPSLSRDIYSDVPMPVAPLAEQGRIVARIDELFAEIAEGEAALERARQGLDTWRRALLKAAVSGELTRDWREANRPAETGADLLARIRTQLGGVATETVPARRPDMQEPRAFFEKPDGWGWARIGDVTEAIDYGTSDKCAIDPVGVPVLRMGNIQDGNLDTSRLKYADPTQVKNLPLLERGDILFNRTNSAELVGKTAIYRGLPAPCSFASYLVRVRIALCEPYFVVYWLNSAFGKSWVAKNKSQQVGQANLSGGKLKRMPVPLPPLLEQKEIVRRVQEQFDVADTDALTIGQVDRDRAALRQAILKGAFEGRLVPQDPTDEPASELLARLRNSFPSNGARRRRVRAAAASSHPSLPGLTRQSLDPRIEPAGDE